MPEIEIDFSAETGDTPPAKTDSGDVGESSTDLPGDGTGAEGEPISNGSGKGSGADGAGEGSAAEAGDSAVERETPEKKTETAEERMRRYQSERDSARAVAEKAAATERAWYEAQKYLVIDQYGQIQGVKPEYASPKPNTQESENQAAQIQELLTNATSGDVGALQNLLWIVKEQAKNEALEVGVKTISEREQAREVEAIIQSDFPGLYKDAEIDGHKVKVIDKDSPLFRETIAVMRDGKTKYNREFDIKNPHDQRLMLELAESRLSKKSYPQMAQKIKDATLRKANESGALGLGEDLGRGTVTDDLSGVLSETELDYYKNKRGYSQAELKEIARTKRLAAKKGGYIIA